uniref:Uncharacterized protein n=1 Tax=Anopheles farauti TaxID=69004 RepID=A0A182Q483_9DIPT
MLRKVSSALERAHNVKTAGTQTAEMELGVARPLKPCASVVQRCTSETQTEEDGFSTQTKKGRVPKERAAAKEVKQLVAKQPKKPTAAPKAKAKKKEALPASEKGGSKGPTAKPEGSKKRRRPKARLSVTKVSAVGDVGTRTHAKMLLGLQEDPALKELGFKVVQTRRAGDGALLLNIKKDADVQALRTTAPLRSKLEGKVIFCHVHFCILMLHIIVVKI